MIGRAMITRYNESVLVLSPKNIVAITAIKNIKTGDAPAPAINISIGVGTLGETIGTSNAVAAPAKTRASSTTKSAVIFFMTIVLYCEKTTLRLTQKHLRFK